MDFIKNLSAKKLFFLGFAFSICSLIANFLKVVLCYNPETELISHSFLSGLFAGFSIAAIVCVAVISYLLASRKLCSVQGRLPQKAQLVTAVLFLIQFLFSLSEQKNQIQADKTAQTNLLFILSLLFCLGSAISFAITSFRAPTRPMSNFLLYLSPVCWSGITAVNVVMKAPDVNSIQGNAEKGIIMVLALLFTLFLLERRCSISQKPLSSLIYTAFGMTVLPYSLPYIAAMLFGVRDHYINTPHSALLGLSIYSLSICFDSCKNENNISSAV